ncbi:EAL domain-containing protein [Acidovorax sp. Root219]|uniref:EAL domain-containing protein n=1 Tax=Acidovorax sp. Root219 TaxID=1736493 RepID=UPI0007088E69|nr:EAL domain-containing protein [Acidovorax sp. Root219]KRC29097.1 diguanylate cyclase [Acidovorax sp. Root219]
MPISVLLIEDDPEHARALVDALVDPWLGWRVEVAPSLAQAQAWLENHTPDILLVCQHFEDGSAYDVLERMGRIPALIIVDAGADAQAAHAMRHGFADFTIRDPGCNYLLALPAQIEAVLERSSSVRARRAAEAMLARQHRLLQAISRAQAVFIASSAPRAAFDALLHELMELTGSRFGLVGQVQRTAEGKPFLRMHSMTDVAWDEATRARYTRDAEEGQVFDDLDSLPGQAMLTEKPVVINDAAGDSRSAGMPPGHPPVVSYLGLPILASGELVAVVGLANRPEGYTAADVQFLQPLLSTVGQLELARRAELARRQVEQELARTSALLAEKTRALQSTLASVSQGITNVDGEGRIRVYNQRYLELLNLPEELLAGEPRVEEVVRFQTERGDFGTGFQLIESKARDYVGAEYAAHGGKLTMPESYIRRTVAGRFIEVRTRPLEGGGRVRTFTDVTDYLGALEALRESEARWRSLTQLSSDWYWEQDAEFRFVRIEGSPQNKMDLPDSQLFGLTRWELPNTFADDGQWRAHREQLAQRQVFRNFEIQRMSAQGDPLWVSISGEPIFDAEGQFTGYRGLARDITERKRAEAEIQRLAFYDELTKLPNRRLLLDRLERVATACERDGQHGALLFLDLDNFKGINDTMGHEWGDRLLVQVGMRLRASVRATDTVARLGGDEFVVVLQGLSSEETGAAVESEAVAQKVLQALNEPYDMDGSELHSTPSIGIALFSDRQQPVNELLKRADLAMYQAKAQGRNTLCFFDPAMQAAATARSALEGDIRQGIQRNEFLLHYQPVVNATGQTMGAEALVRWQHPQRGMVPPGQFIPLAEQTGLILPLGQRVLHLACEQLARWNREPATQAWTVAVNVSAQEFRHTEFVPQVLQALYTTGADPGRLKLELTESLLLSDVEESIVKMQVLRNLGVGFSLDDFGTGYSSLSYLKRLPLDQLKIDQSFVRDVLTDPNDAAIACTIVALAHSLGLDVVAEGVETEGQHDFLLRNGCQQFQGYLFGRPGPAEALQPG